MAVAQVLTTSLSCWRAKVCRDWLFGQLRLSRVKSCGTENSSGKHRSFLDIVDG